MGKAILGCRRVNSVQKSGQIALGRKVGDWEIGNDSLPAGVYKTEKSGKDFKSSSRLYISSSGKVESEKFCKISWKKKSC
jgi:hypothetical protein